VQERYDSLPEPQSRAKRSAVASARVLVHARSAVKGLIFRMPRYQAHALFAPQIRRAMVNLGRREREVARASRDMDQGGPGNARRFKGLAMRLVSAIMSNPWR
jgi:hypothetical protein